MYKEGILNIVPILYFIIPIILGLVTGFVLKEFTSNIIIYSIITSVSLSVIHLIILSFIFNSTKSEFQLLSILFIWNSFLIFISNMIYLSLNKLYVKKLKIKS